MPKPSSYDGQRLPATYVNFYFVNGALLVPRTASAIRSQAIETLQQPCRSTK